MNKRKVYWICRNWIELRYYAWKSGLTIAEYQARSARIAQQLQKGIHEIFNEEYAKYEGDKLTKIFESKGENAPEC